MPNEPYLPAELAILLPETHTQVAVVGSKLQRSFKEPCVPTESRPEPPNSHNLPLLSVQAACPVPPTAVLSVPERRLRAWCRNAYSAAMRGGYGLSPDSPKFPESPTFGESQAPKIPGRLYRPGDFGEEFDNCFRILSRPYNDDGAPNNSNFTDPERKCHPARARIADPIRMTRQ